MASIGSTITSAEYNSIQGSVESILGLGTGTSGYGQDVLSSTILPGAPVTETAFDNLRADIAKCYAHQQNASVVDSAPIGVPNLLNVGTATVISSNIFNQYNTMKDNIVANKDAAAAAQMTQANVATATRTTAWGGSIDSIEATVTFTFNGYTQGGLTVTGADHARVFFNAGGELRLTSTLSNTGTSKNLDWQDMLNGVGQLRLGRTSTSITGSGLFAGSQFNSTTGFFDRTVGAAEFLLLSQAGSLSVYAENRYQIFFSRPTSNTVQFRIVYADNDPGDKTGIGPAVDENVGGTLTLTPATYTAFGSNVAVPAPTRSGTSGANSIV